MMIAHCGTKPRDQPHGAWTCIAIHTERQYHDTYCCYANDVHHSDCQMQLQPHRRPGTGTAGAQAHSAEAAPTRSKLSASLQSSCRCARPDTEPVHWDKHPHVNCKLAAKTHNAHVPAQAVPSTQCLDNRQLCGHSHRNNRWASAAPYTSTSVIHPGQTNIHSTINPSTVAQTAAAYHPLAAASRDT
jgi:hypothetical protein